MLGPWLNPIFRAILYSSSLVLADQAAARPGSSSYRGKDPCPAQCNVAGPVSSNWSVYHSLDKLQQCSQQLFLDFSIYDQVDDPTIHHRLRACTVWGADWGDVVATPIPASAVTVNVTFQLGSWHTGSTVVASFGDVLSLAGQMQTYFANGHSPTNRTTIVFGLSKNATIGIYLGKALQGKAIGEGALKRFKNTISTIDVFGGWAMQLCGSGRDADHVFGVIAAANGTFAAVQNAMQLWSKAECLDGLSQTSSITSSIVVTAPPLVPIMNSTDLSQLFGPNGTIPTIKAAGAIRSLEIARRGDCKTIQVVSRDGCASLAAKCQISGNIFMSYNPQANLCSTLQPGQHVCCSAGTLPNFQPQPNSDGSCATYTTVAGDSCYAIAAVNSLTTSNLESFNHNTWGWNGCSNLWVGVKMCLSTGTPPMPAPVANAICGPQVPGTARPPTGTDLSTLNPCLLNACCDVWGQCGTTTEFCTNTSTGAPGTAQVGTNGCISNCGTNIVRSSPPATYFNIAYFEDFNLDRPCLNMDISQLSAATYTHVHFAFATLTSNYQVVIGDATIAFEFQEFVALKGPKRILSFGGWDFSTNPSTYMIFRQGVTAANRLTMATNIANFIIANNLDGVDIDWEYPGAPDIPGIPPASTSDGANYLAFLVILKNLLHGKTVSVAAPASYWYLKGFPIMQISRVIDYVIYETYDLHGQWDYGNKWSDPECPGGNCLRSDVNLTETINALVMITKAGVPSNKVIVGVTSYGRSYQMTTPGCYGEMCTFTGPASGATIGPCTGVAGYISDAEIKQIASTNRVNYNGFDQGSQTNILVYDNNQWVGWMDPTTKATRVGLYRASDMGGVSDWAVDLENYQPDPIPAGWQTFKNQIKLGSDPYIEGNRTGNWTSLFCTDPAVEGLLEFTPNQRWGMLDCDNAWQDALNVYTNIDQKNGVIFSESISNTFHGPESMNCSSLLADSNCDNTIECTQGVGTGPAGYEVLNSLIVIHEMFKNYYNALFQISGILFAGFQAFENDFAPVPPASNDLLQIILDLVGLGALMIAAPFFDAYLATLPFFIANTAARETLGDEAFSLIQATVSIIKDLNQNGGTQWSPASQASFSAYMGQVVWGWSNVTEAALELLMGGSSTGIQMLSTLIADGQLIEGSTNGKTPPSSPSNSGLQASIALSFYAYCIPVAWSMSGNRAFILDAGSACGKFSSASVSTYLGTTVASATGACYNGNQYYLVTPSGLADTCRLVNRNLMCTPNPFSEPPGLDKLDGTAYGGVTLQILVNGSVRTYQQNNNQNGASAPSSPGGSTITDLYNQDVTTPGYIRLPVCGPAEAFINWANAQHGGENATYPNYPCNP